ncbi:hypothetical protein CBM2605_U10040 [Cupriavidus neocaledonicus]|uniref:Transposase n=1 Tax=Cupriavidus neocaledonicus TaxID=1040979 RepID=A0ABY1VEK0_9BURK|nr:hypothetical protein CBM2605_U10040 [Cupriavidus neocaledonicus]
MTRWTRASPAPLVQVKNASRPGRKEVAGYAGDISPRLPSTACGGSDHHESIGTSQWKPQRP